MTQQTVHTIDGTWDDAADAVYLPLRRIIPDNSVPANIVIEDARVRGMIVIDLDANGQVVGIEIIGASAALGRRHLKALIENP